MMSARTTPRRCRIGCLAISAATLSFTGFAASALAQQAARTNTVNAGQARVAAPAAPAEGLDSLKDDAVIAKLSALNQTSLVNRLFDVNNVPKDQRAGFTVVRSLEELSNTPLEKLTSCCAVASRPAHSVPSEQLAFPRLPGLTDAGDVLLPLQKSVSPATEAIIGICALMLYCSLTASAMRPAHPVCVDVLWAAFCHSSC